MFATTLLWCVFALASHAVGQEEERNRFTYPPTDKGLIEFPAFSPVELRWTCPDCGNDHVWLRVWQRRDNESFASEALLDDAPMDDNTKASYTWQSHFYEDLTFENTFHFQANYPNTVFISGNMRMVASTSPSPTPATLSVSATSSPSPSSSPTASTTSIADANPTASPPPGASASSSSSNETLKVGLGVGLGIGIPSLAIICGLAGYLWRQRRSATPAVGVHETQDEKVEMPPTYIHLNPHGPPQEMPEWRGETRELPA